MYYILKTVKNKEIFWEEYCNQICMLESSHSVEIWIEKVKVEARENT